MFNKKVSIIIPVYNGSNFLKDAIESALNQTYNNIEIIVVDDGSNDNGKTQDIALSYGDKIKYFNKENGGVASALNFGIQKMTGDYFSWLSHDDLYYSNKIEEQIKLLNENENIIVSSNYELINENGVLLQSINSEYKYEELLYKLLIKSFLNGCTLLIPREAFQKIGVFDEKLKTTQDYHLWFQFIKKYKFINCNKYLVKSRQHPNQDSNTKIKLAQEERKILEKYVFSIYSIEEIKKSKGSKLPNLIFFIYLKIKLAQPKIINLFIYSTKKLGIYKNFSFLWRKYILKLGKNEKNTSN